MACTARLRRATESDAAAISAICNHYVRHSTCTYREEPESLAERHRWLTDHDAGHVVLIAEEPDGQVVGWGALSPFHQRSGFRFTVEDSLYVRDDRLGRGIGGVLLGELMSYARQGGFRSVVAVISADQEASIALHRRHGFAEAGRLQRAGFKFGRWLDVVYFQAELAPAGA